MFLCEGETDTMRLWQELHDAGKLEETDVVGVGGCEAWSANLRQHFDGADAVYACLDNDEDYNVKAQVDRAWLTIRRDLGPKVKRVRLPSGVKDLCEFFKLGNTLDSLRGLIAQPASRFKPLNLAEAHKPRPVNWLVEDLIAQGDITMLLGEPGVGKSWLSMSLALAIVQGWETWLGQPLCKSGGRVLYVDEENPEDDVYRRLCKLGLRDGDASHFRYLHEQGIRLDKDPAGILEEAITFEPTLIVLDSLTRIHTENENDAGAIARLFNDGIKPLARQTGATVIVLHHANKGNEGSTYKRARGSGDITAAIDTALDVRQDAPGFLTVLHAKTRRRLPHSAIHVRLNDTPDGLLKVETNVEAPPPF